MNAKTRKRIVTELWEAQNHRCLWCEKVIPRAIATLEHLIAKADGGTDDRINLAAACASCNRKRGLARLTREEREQFRQRKLRRTKRNHPELEW